VLILSQTREISQYLFYRTFRNL